MLKKQAPGETILKVGGMLLLFLGVLLAFGSGNTLSLVMKGSSDSAVVEYLNQNGMTYSQLVASNVMVLVAGVIYHFFYKNYGQTYKVCPIIFIIYTINKPKSMLA